MIERFVCAGQGWAVQKTAELINMWFGDTLLWARQTITAWGATLMPPGEDQWTTNLWPQWVCSAKNSSTDRDAVYRAYSCGLKEQRISWVSTLVQPGEYDWTFSCTSQKGNSAYRSNSAYICNSAYPFIHWGHSQVSY